MRRFVSGMLALAAIFGPTLIALQTKPQVVISAQQAANLSVRSNTFHNGGMLPMSTVFNGFGCTGRNRSPHLAWSGEPSGTVSFALILHDPDAPTGTGWYHWVAFNIPPHCARAQGGCRRKGIS